MDRQPPKVEELDPEVERRIFAMVQMISGRESVDTLSEKLGLSRERLYELMHLTLDLLREGLKPRKPGRKAKSVDPEKELLKRQLKQTERKLARAESLLAIATRQARGPDKDPDPTKPRRPRRGHKGNRYPPAEKAETLEHLDQEKDLGTSQADFSRATQYPPRTLNRWKHRRQAAALADRPSRPEHVPSRIPETRREEIRHLALVKQGTYGAMAIRMALAAPESVSTIGRILREPWQPSEVVWTRVGACQALDFMHLGPLTGWGRLLTVQDEASRFKPLWELRPRWTDREVAGYLLRAWKLLGVPAILKHDQGPEFISGYFQGFLAEHRVLSMPSPPYRGSYNGKEERSNGFIRAWTRPVERSGAVELLPRRLSEACQDLNYERPLKVLGARTPYEAFSSGPRISSAERQRLLLVAESWAKLQSVEAQCKERGLWIRRKAAVVAAQDVGLLVIRPRQKCQPIPA